MGIEDAITDVTVIHNDVITDNPDLVLNYLLSPFKYLHSQLLTRPNRPGTAKVFYPFRYTVAAPRSSGATPRSIVQPTRSVSPRLVVRRLDLFELIVILLLPR